MDDYNLTSTNLEILALLSSSMFNLRLDPQDVCLWVFEIFLKLKINPLFAEIFNVLVVL